MERKYLVIGAGALGSVFGGFLQKTGKDVTYIGKGEHFDVILKKGIKIEGIWGNHKIDKIKGYYDTEVFKIDQKFDIILLCVKSQDTKTAAELAKPLLKDDGICVSVQNGLDNVEKISDVLGGARTVGARVIFGVEINTPGCAKVSVYADKVLLGEPFLEVNKYHLIGLANSLNEAGIPSDITDNISGYIWAKALYNCALNPLSAVLNVTYGELADNGHTRKIMEKIIREVYAVAKAKGVKLLLEEADDYISLFFNKLIPPTKGHHSSMYQDLRAGKKTEIDAMNNAIVKYAEFYNLKAPVNFTITNLIKFKEEGLLS